MTRPPLLARIVAEVIRAADDHDRDGPRWNLTGDPEPKKEPAQ